MGSLVDNGAHNVVTGQGNALYNGKTGSSNWFAQGDPLYSLFGHHWSNAIKPMTAAQQNNVAQGERRYGAGQIAQAFDSPARDKQYADYMSNLRGLGTDQLNQQKTLADRNLKFADARSGMTGGSVAADNGGLLQRDYQGGLLSVADNARTATDALRTQDQAEKNNLIALNNAGSNVGQDSTNALAQAGMNIKNAQAANTMQSLGDVFGNLSSQYQKYRAATAPPSSAWG